MDKSLVFSHRKETKNAKGREAFTIVKAELNFKIATETHGHTRISGKYYMARVRGLKIHHKGTKNTKVLLKNYIKKIPK